MITHDEAQTLARLFGRAVARGDRATVAKTNALLNQYLTQPDAEPVRVLLAVACEEVKKEQEK